MSFISKRRSDFYANYLVQKQVVFSRLEREVFDQSQRDLETISCHKGCAYCCCVYIEATRKECEAIVCYLYQNEEVLISFLKRYPDWRNKTRQLGDLCTETLGLVRTQEQNEEVYRNLTDTLLFYKLQNIPCPFLIENSCSIHFARPFTCAAHFVTTPPEWCSPLDSRESKIYKGSFEDKIADVSLYNEQLSDLDITFMPMKVYEIIQKDRADLSKANGLPTPEFEEMNNSKIAVILQTYL
jgi:Fe-S-cluster containining protein